MGLLRPYRSTGADLPFGDPLRAHGVAMEGYFWRFTERSSGRVLIALIGVNRRGSLHWATVGVAASAHGEHPAYLLTDALPDGFADPARLGARSGDAFTGSQHSVRVDLPGCMLDLRIDSPVPWPRRFVGGSSGFQAIPALNQYWHPWLLGGRGSGTAQLGGETWHLQDAQVYGEKNWGAGGFPDSWWWGQAQGFTEPAACVAFAGGEVTAGPLRTEVTALVVRLPDGRVLRLGNPGLSPVRAEVTDTSWRLRGRSATWAVDVEASAPLAQAHVLPVPLPDQGRNTAGAIEHLSGELAITVRHRGRLVWSGESRCAGLEHGGLDRAEAELRRRGRPAGSVDAAPEPG